MRPRKPKKNFARNRAQGIFHYWVLRKWPWLFFSNWPGFSEKYHGHFPHPWILCQMTLKGVFFPGPAFSIMFRTYASSSKTSHAFRRRTLQNSGANLFGAFGSLSTGFLFGILDQIQLRPAMIEAHTVYGPKVLHQRLVRQPRISEWVPRIRLRTVVSIPDLGASTRHQISSLFWEFLRI